MNLEDDEPLDLSEDMIVDDALEAANDDTIIGFGDEEDDEGGEEESPVIKKLRARDRELSGKVAEMQRKLSAYQQGKAPANDDDVEPVIPPKKRVVEDFDYDVDKFDAYDDERTAAIRAHAEWKVRQSERENARKRAQDEQSRKIEQQRAGLGVADYEDRSAKVREVLSDQQLAVLINAADNPARVIYALGRSQTHLDQIAGEENLAKLAAMIGRMERDIKVTKRKAPAVDTAVRGATATFTASSNKELERLEKEAERTGVRTKVIEYKRKMKKTAA